MYDIYGKPIPEDRINENGQIRFPTDEEGMCEEGIHGITRVVYLSPGKYALAWPLIVSAYEFGLNSFEGYTEEQINKMLVDYCNSEYAAQFTKNPDPGEGYQPGFPLEWRQYQKLVAEGKFEYSGNYMGYK